MTLIEQATLLANQDFQQPMYDRLGKPNRFLNLEAINRNDLCNLKFLSQSQSYSLLTSVLPAQLISACLSTSFLSLLASPLLPAMTAVARSLHHLLQPPQLQRTGSRTEKSAVWPSSTYPSLISYSALTLLIAISWYIRLHLLCCLWWKVTQSSRVELISVPKNFSYSAI